MINLFSYSLDKMLERVFIKATEAETIYLKMQNKILLSKLKQKNTEIEILNKQMKRIKKYQVKLFRMQSTQCQQKSKRKKKIINKKDYIPYEHIPKSLLSDLNPAIRFPKHEKENRKLYSRKKK